MYGLDPIDRVIDQSLDHMDQFNQSQGFLFHLNRDSINQKGSNQRRNVLNFGFNFGKKNVEFTVGALYWDLLTQQVGPISLLKYVIQVGPIAHLEWRCRIDP